ncbi:MAG: hypothetical protein QM778_33880 [Myxococcales bacterium]
MTQVVTVHTDFTDLNQMAQGLVGRVNETHVILPGPDVVDVGDWVQFAVTLYDGTPGFAGVGRCVTVVDNGEDRLSHQRFDVVIDSLQFDSRGQQIFEHILMLNGPEEGVATDDAGYAEPDATHETGSFEDVSEDFRSQPALEAYPAHSEEEATVMADRADVQAALERSAMMDDDDEVAVVTMPPPANAPSPAAMLREAPVVHAAPAAAAPAVNGHVAPSAPRAVNGMSFRYTDGLPFPNVPPRPELDPARRVSKAPRPSKA